MRRLTILSLTLLLFWSLGFSQDLNIELNVHNKKIDFYRELEKKLGSEKFNSEVSYISGGQVSQPEIFLRKEKDLPDLLVYYTFFTKDSTISEIEYEWDVYNFDKKENNVKSLDFDKNLIEKYKQIVAFFSSKYGTSETEGSLDDVSKINSSDGLTRSDVWKSNDSLKIYSYTSISNYYKKNGSVTIGTTHRIRVYVSNLKEEKPDKLSQENLKMLDRKFNSFITLLSENNLAETKKLFSDKIINTVTDEILTQLKSIVIPNNKLELFMSGMQVTQDGNIYPMLQYKYSLDTNMPPKQYIMVLFDNDDKIIGLRPMKRE